MARSRKNPNADLTFPVLVDLMALQRLTHVTHWESKDYGDHLLFERIYKSVTKSIDPLAELIVGDGYNIRGEGIIQSASKLYAEHEDHGREGVRHVANILLNDIRVSLGTGPNQERVSTGMRNFLEDLAQKTEEILYLLGMQNKAARRNGAEVGTTFYFVKPFHLTANVFEHRVSALHRRMELLGYIVARRDSKQDGLPAASLTVRTPARRSMGGLPVPRTSPITWEELQAAGLEGEYLYSGTEAAPPSVRKPSKRGPTPPGSKRGPGKGARSKPKHKDRRQGNRTVRQLRGKANPGHAEYLGAPHPTKTLWKVSPPAIWEKWVYNDDGSEEEVTRQSSFVVVSTANDAMRTTLFSSDRGGRLGDELDDYHGAFDHGDVLRRNGWVPDTNVTSEIPEVPDSVRKMNERTKGSEFWQLLVGAGRAKPNGGFAPKGDGIKIRSSNGKTLEVKASTHQWRRKSDWWMHVTRDFRRQTKDWTSGTVTITRDGRARSIPLEEFREMTAGSQQNWRSVRNPKKTVPKERNWTSLRAKQRKAGPHKNKALRGSGKGKGKAARHPKHKGR